MEKALGLCSLPKRFATVIFSVYQLLLWSMQACTDSSPHEGPFKNDAPAWCVAPFEPEGILRYLSLCHVYGTCVIAACSKLKLLKITILIVTRQQNAVTNFKTILMGQSGPMKWNSGGEFSPLPVTIKKNSSSNWMWKINLPVLILQLIFCGVKYNHRCALWACTCPYEGDTISSFVLYCGVGKQRL